MSHDLKVARSAVLKPITDIASQLGLLPDDIEQYGKYKAKISHAALDRLKSKHQKETNIAGSINSGSKKYGAQLVLVTAISPTPLGEGKSTTTVGLGDALTRLGKKTVIALREPSMGPCFGIKGGATGGGYSQVVPMEDINLHFTGDFHAITSAHNLLVALLDNHIQQGNKLNIDPRRVSVRRCLDMNDRSLRQVVIGLGGSANGSPRESGFDITVACETMAVFCLSRNLKELETKLGDIIVAETYDRKVVRARDLKAHGAMTVLLKEALQPNLVQTLEHTPALIHGGPFANIAHGCNSLLATETAMSLGDYVVTEAGFGADLGAQKFIDIKCRQSGLRPNVAVIVATVRALKRHAGVDLKQLMVADAEAVKRGCANLKRHIENMQSYGLPVIVSINHFVSDSPEEIETIASFCKALGVPACLSKGWAEGGKGVEPLAKAVIAACENQGATGAGFHLGYDNSLGLKEKLEWITRNIYRASRVEWAPQALQKLAQYTEQGFAHLPICVAKTQYSFSHNPDLLGVPEDFTFAVRDARLCAGAGFIVILSGDVMTMPGLPKVPAAESIMLSDEGLIEGLF